MSFYCSLTLLLGFVGGIIFTGILVSVITRQRKRNGVKERSDKKKIDWQNNIGRRIFNDLRRYLLKHGDPNLEIDKVETSHGTLLKPAGFSILVSRKESRVMGDGVQEILNVRIASIYIDTFSGSPFPIRVINRAGQELTFACDDESIVRVCRFVNGTIQEVLVGMQ